MFAVGDPLHIIKLMDECLLVSLSSEACVWPLLQRQQKEMLTMLAASPGWL
jgi:hypothetical protein